MNKKANGWDTVAWIILALICLWLILKAFGVFNTPMWLQYSPLFGVVYLAGWSMKKLSTATDDIKVIKTDLNGIDKDMNILKNSCPELNKKK